MCSLLSHKQVVAGLGLLLVGCLQPPLSAPSSLHSVPSELPGGCTPVSYQVRPALPAPRPIPSDSCVLPVEYRQPGTASSSSYSLRPSLPSVVPAPQCSYAADYRWLVGCLQQDPISQRWRVRFASPEAGEKHGGELDLLQPGPMHGFASGQFVRVEGELVDPLPLEIKPAYRVHSLQRLPR